MLMTETFLADNVWSMLSYIHVVRKLFQDDLIISDQKSTANPRFSCMIP